MRIPLPRHQQKTRPSRHLGDPVKATYVLQAAPVHLPAMRCDALYCIGKGTVSVQAGTNRCKLGKLLPRVAGLADDANRRRMAARLAPGESQPVTVLLNLVAPVRNHAHNHIGAALLKGQKPAQLEFNELADAASPDSLVARRFELDAERFIRGNRTAAAALKATLASWRDNHDRFAAVAIGNPKLEAALPISADITALCGVGLDAVAAIESGHPPNAEWRARAKELLDRQAAAEKASESTVMVFTTQQQPPADLLISIIPGVRKLVMAAMSVGP